MRDEEIYFRMQNVNFYFSPLEIAASSVWNNTYNGQEHT